MKLFYNNTEILDIQVDDTSVRYRSIMQDNNLTLNFNTVEPVSVPVGSYCEFEGQIYKLYYPENFKKHNTRNFEYTLVLHSDQEALKLYKYKDMSAKPYRLKFPLTARPYDFIKLLVDNLNQHDAGWNVGRYIEADDKLISFNHESCYDILNRLASEFNTEWEIENKTIHLRKVEKFKDDPLPLSYGKGNGFKSGVGRSNEGDKQPIGRLYVQGGERNIDYAKYGSKSLLLPKSKDLTFDGKRYFTDADGMYVFRNNGNVAEGSLDATHIYPKYIGTVQKVIDVNTGKNYYDIVDSNIPDIEHYRIEGEKATITFQSGALAGREFDIVQTEHEIILENEEVETERVIQIIPVEHDGFMMPSNIFMPEAGDKYIVLNIAMPESYVQDAQSDMLLTAVKYFADNEDPKFSFRGELDGVWSKNKWLQIGGKIVPGSHILFSDTQFQPNGIKIRITSIKDYVNMPHKPQITLSNAPISMSFANDIGKIESEEVTRDEQNKDTLRFTKRQWRDTIETMGMLEKSLLNFSNSINPITVQTMQLLVGDESLQFRFVSSKTSPATVPHKVVYDKKNKTLTSHSGTIQHMTLGINSIKKTHADNEYKFWEISKYVSPPLVASKSYYLYASVSDGAENGLFILSEDAIKINEAPGSYYLLVGILNSEYNGDRSYVSMYGFTEILPGRVTTDKIVSTDGRTYFDLVQGIIGGRIRFLSNGVEKDLNDWANMLQNDLTWLDDNIDDLEDYLDGAFKDGVISEAEAKVIESYFQSIYSQRDAIEATYNKLFVNPLLSGTPKTNLLNSKISFFGEVQSLASLIIEVTADGKVTPSESVRVDIAFVSYRQTYALFSQRIQEANDAIQKVLSDNTSAALSQANLAKAITDKFGTTIDGGLISTVIMLLRGHNSTTETAGTSGLQDGAAFWAGGTYAQALAGLAKIILNHDGSGQLAGKKVVWDKNGNIKYAGKLEGVSGSFSGRLTQPFLRASDYSQSLSVVATQATATYLPVSPELNGGTVRVYAENRASTSVSIEDNSYFLGTNKKIINVADGNYAEFVCIYDDARFIGWLPLSNIGSNDGLLLAGTISQNGAIVRQIGEKEIVSCYRNSIGVFQINHDIGHTNYIVNCTPDGEHLVSILSRFSNYFIIETRARNTGSMIYAGFDLQVVGRSS